MNPHGLHTRAADKLVKCASRCESSVTIRYKDRTVNAKSILAVMTLGAGKGSEIELTVTGRDEQQALTALETLIQDRFGETE